MPNLHTETYIPVRWRLPIRILWLLIAVTLFTIYFMGLKPTYNELSSICHTADCPIITLAPVELEILKQYGLTITHFAYYFLALEAIIVVLFASLGVLVFWLRSDTLVGLVISLAFLFTALAFFTEENRALGRVYLNFQIYSDFLTSLSVVLVLLLFYLFPNGRFTPRWMGWFATALFVAITLDPLLNQSGIQASSTTMFVIIIFAIGAPMGLISQIYRFWKISNPTQRQQTKWGLYGFLSMFAGMLPWLIFVEISPLPPGPARLIFYLTLIPQYILVCFFPIAVAIAILRYRLWDIDIIIRRTVQYTAVSAILIGVYYGSVVVLQSFFTTLLGASSTLTIVLSTLLIAALFNPLRHRVQTFIDRRFYRRKYNTEQILAQFAQTARDEVELEKLTAELVAVVQETMQPEKISLWIK